MIRPKNSRVNSICGCSAFILSVMLGDPIFNQLIKSGINNPSHSTQTNIPGSINHFDILFFTVMKQTRAI